MLPVRSWLLTLEADQHPSGAALKRPVGGNTCRHAASIRLSLNVTCHGKQVERQFSDRSNSSARRTGEGKWSSSKSGRDQDFMPIRWKARQIKAIHGLQLQSLIEILLLRCASWKTKGLEEIPLANKEKREKFSRPRAGQEIQPEGLLLSSIRWCNHKQRSICPVAPIFSLTREFS